VGELLAIGAAGVVATALTAWAVAHSPTLVDPTGSSLARGAFVAAHAAVGAYTWWRRPTSRLGPLLLGTAFLLSAYSLNTSGAPLAYTLGMVLFAVLIVYAAFLYLSFPRGRLESRSERAVIWAMALCTAVLWALILALSPTLPEGGNFGDCGTRCPQNALQIVSGNAATGDVLIAAYGLVTAIAGIVVAVMIFRKARSPEHLRRRAMTPLAAVLIAVIAEYVLFLLIVDAYPETRNALRVADAVLTIAVPLALLVGQIRGRVFAATRVGQIAVRASNEQLTPASAQEAIGDALGDPSLTLALWAPERAGYVDVDGAPLELPRDAPDRAVTRVARNNQPAAALIHDPTLDVDPDVVEALVATSLVLLENARLVEDLRASRSRIVETAERERRRLERDLHDGAQQRLVALNIRLGMVRELVDREDVANAIDATQRDAEAALEELRALAHGIYPPALRGRGPAVALRELARGSPVPIQVTDEGIGRSSDLIEAAIYFCAREAIQNTAKHAGPSAKVTVTLARRQHAIAFTVSDDGPGMTRETDTSGTGITGMRDRIEAVGGEFEIVSAPGQGTSIRATIPDDEG
jgi:signal transduction histidine kinase